MSVPDKPTSLFRSGRVQLSADEEAFGRLLQRVREQLAGASRAGDFWTEEGGPEVGRWEGIPGPAGTVVVRVELQADRQAQVTVASLQDLEPVHPPDAPLRQTLRKFQLLAPLGIALLAFGVSWTIAPRETFDLFTTVTTALVGLIALFAYWPICDAFLGLNKMVWADVASEVDIDDMASRLQAILEAAPGVTVLEAIGSSRAAATA